METYQPLADADVLLPTPDLAGKGTLTLFIIRSCSHAERQDSYTIKRQSAFPIRPKSGGSTNREGREKGQLYTPGEKGGPDTCADFPTKDPQQVQKGQKSICKSIQGTKKQMRGFT